MLVTMSNQCFKNDFVVTHFFLTLKFFSVVHSQQEKISSKINIFIFFKDTKNNKQFSNCVWNVYLIVLHAFDAVLEIEIFHDLWIFFKKKIP